MPETGYDVLSQPVFGTRSSQGSHEVVTLPGVLARLGSDDIRGFPALQAHQTHAWHAFLVQLAGLALNGAGKNQPRQSEGAWTDLLLALTAGEPEPWCLVVEDLSRPAFMQPPVPEGSLASFKGRIAFPDSIDVLVTTKDHDVKGARIAEPRPEHWIYALVSLQTMQGYSGKYNYGIVRMNGGYGNRPCLAFTPSRDWGPWFRRDTNILLSDRQRIAASYGYPADGGQGLVWVEPWDGTTEFPIDKCDPFFIEICRRVRLEEDGGRLIARTAPSKVKRIATAIDNGETGDPWTPLKAADGAAFTLDRSGFTYRRLYQLLFTGDFQLGAAAKIQAQDDPVLILVAKAMVRGQGKTDGLHERAVPIPASIRRRLGNPPERTALANLAQRRVDQVSRADRNVLHPALCVLLQAGPEKADFRDRRTQPWRDRFDAEVDRIFFARLWDDIDLPPLEAESRWAQTLRELAKFQLDDAIASAPVPIARRYRAVAAAERVFGGAFRKHFPQLYERSADDPESSG